MSLLLGTGRSHSSGLLGLILIAPRCWPFQFSSGLLYPISASLPDPHNGSTQDNLHSSLRKPVVGTLRGAALPPSSLRIWGCCNLSISASTSSSHSSNSNAVCDILSGQLGFKEKDLEQIRRDDPGLLQKCQASDVQLKVSYFRYSLGLTQQQYRHVVKSWPRGLLLNLDGRVKVAVAFFHGLGLDSDDIRLVLKRWPSALKLPVASMQSTVTYIQEELELSTNGVCKVVTLCPRLLGLRLENNLMKTTEYFCDTIGLTRPEVGKMMALKPSVFSLSVEDNIKVTVAYLREELCLRHSHVASILKRAPSLLCYNLKKNVRVKVDFLRENLGVSNTEVGSLLIAAPTILGLSLENMEAKLAFFKEQGVDIQAGLTKYPLAMGMSLEGRLRPRFAYMRHIGKQPGTLREMAAAKDDKWVAAMHISLEQYQRWYTRTYGNAAGRG
mmetsp:Transcript_37240/g.105075  ORF Transcript_37240/g.105075 Transcript_37240/m.105075 type:complete len:442 (-) Transcript_37240:217-1542(-)